MHTSEHADVCTPIVIPLRSTQAKSRRNNAAGLAGQAHVSAMRPHMIPAKGELAGQTWWSAWFAEREGRGTSGEPSSMAATGQTPPRRTAVAFQASMRL